MKESAEIEAMARRLAALTEAARYTSFYMEESRAWVVADSGGETKNFLRHEEGFDSSHRPSWNWPENPPHVNGFTNGVSHPADLKPGDMIERIAFVDKEGGDFLTAVLRRPLGQSSKNCPCHRTDLEKTPSP